MQSDLKHNLDFGSIIGEFLSTAQKHNGRFSKHNRLKPKDGKFMLHCDECGKWLHGECVGLSSSQELRMEECGEHYLYPLCDPCPRCQLKCYICLGFWLGQL